MERIEVTKKELDDLKVGTIFQIDVWDYDDYNYWTFTYCKGPKGYIYLGGGMDFGSAIGKVDTIEHVLEGVNSADFPEITICHLEMN